MKRFLVVTVVMLALVASCGGKKTVKRVSEDSKIAAEAMSVAETIKEAYIKRDVGTIEKNATRDGFRVIKSALRTFDSAELSFNPVLIEMEENTVQLNISWNGKWQKGGVTTEERGMTVLVMTGRPLKVDNILRANPFKYPE